MTIARKEGRGKGSGWRVGWKERQRSELERHNVEAACYEEDKAMVSKTLVSRR